MLKSYTLLYLKIKVKLCHSPSGLMALRNFQPETDENDFKSGARRELGRSIFCLACIFSRYQLSQFLFMHPPYKGVTLFLLTRSFLLLKSDPILVILSEMQLSPSVKMRPHTTVTPISAVHKRFYLKGSTIAREAELFETTPSASIQIAHEVL